MRTLITLLIVSLFLSCGTAGNRVNVEAGMGNGNVLTSPAIPAPEAPVSAESIGSTLGYLSGDALGGRESGEEGIEMAAAYIAGYFKSVGVQPYYPEYRDTLKNIEVSTANIVGYLEGNDPAFKDEWVILGAHYDHIGTTEPVAGDYIANGANDNASGTTAVMEIARKMAESASNKRSVMFVLFAAEEKGLKGSSHLAERLDKEGLNIYTMLNFEMVGVPLKKDYLAYITGYEMSNMADQLNEYAGENLIGFLPQAKEFNLFKRSDNYPFYERFKVPSQTVCTFDFTNFDHYHKPDDEFELMDLGHMASFVNQMIPVVQGLVNSEQGAVRMNQ